jgi:hypothetical protein
MSCNQGSGPPTSLPLARWGGEWSKAQPWVSIERMLSPAGAFETFADAICKPRVPSASRDFTLG